ncbi:ATP-binding protein [Burkholderia pyrrocinia]
MVDSVLRRAPAGAALGVSMLAPFDTASGTSQLTTVPRTHPTHSSLVYIEQIRPVHAFSLDALPMAVLIVAIGILYGLLFRSRRHADSIEPQQPSADQHDTLLDHLPFPVVVLDHCHRVAIANSAFGRLVGQSSDALLGQPADVLRRANTEPGRSLAALLRRSGGQPRVDRGELHYVERSCRPRVLLYWTVPLPAHDSYPMRTLIAFSDVTPIRNAERAARYREEHLLDITANLPGIVYKLRRNTDGSLSFRYVNGDTRSLFGLTPQQMMADERLAFATVHPNDQRSLMHAVEMAAAWRTGYRHEFRVRAPDGERWIHSQGAYNPSSPKGTQEWDGYWIDVTDSHRQAEALYAARLAAERASSAQARFLATMSHEVRTPMSGIFSILELLTETALTPAQQNMVDTIRTAAQSMLCILDNVLDYSRIDADKLILESKPFDLRELLEGICQTASADLLAKDLQLRVAIDARLAAQVRGDSLRVRQILSNLLNNALKFTERGAIDVRLRIMADLGEQQTIEIDIADTGIGIATEHMKHVCVPFAQADESTPRRFGGFGLGLPICRQLTKKMHGDLHLSSEPGKGTTATVCVTLPVVTRLRPPLAGCIGRRAGVELHDRALASLVETELAATGIIIADADDQAPLDLLVMDENPETPPAPGPVVVALTPRTVFGGWDSDAAPPILSAQPLFPGAVRALCAHLFAPAARKRGAAPQATQPAVPNGLAPILIAEDQALCQIVWQQQLDSLGYPYRIVSNGDEALVAMQTAPCSMLFTDLWMPRMNGFTLTRHWRAHEAGSTDRRRLPIVGISANIIHGDRNMRSGLGAGMDAALSKPLPLAALRTLLERYLPAVETTDGEPTTNAARSTLDTLQATYGSRNVLAMLDAALDACVSQRATLAAPDAKANAVSACVHDLLAAAHLFQDAPLIAACLAARQRKTRRTNSARQRQAARATLLRALDAFVARLDGLRATLDARTL